MAIHNFSKYTYGNSHQLAIIEYTTKVHSDNKLSMIIHVFFISQSCKVLGSMEVLDI